MTTREPPVLETPVQNRLQSSRGWKTPWPLVALALIIAFNLLFTPGFLKIWLQDGRLAGMLIDIPDVAGPLILVALGMTLVLATGGVDLSVGAVMAIAGSLASVLLRADFPLPAVLALSLAVAILAGLWNGFLVGVVNLQPIIATLILMVAGRGIAQMISGGQNVSTDYPGFTFLGTGYLFALPFTIVLAVAMIALTWALTRRTALGLFVESVGNNATASHYAGINATLVKLLVYAFSGFCAGIAGLVAVSDIKQSNASQTGLYMELDAILGVVIGGTALAGGRFLLAGSVVGALIIQSMTTMIQARGVQAEKTLVVKALVVLAICVLQSDPLRRFLATALRRRPA